MNDTIMYLKRLEAVGVPRQQAEEQVTLMVAISQNFALSKSDLGALDTRVGSIERRLGVLEVRMERLEERVDAIEKRLGALETRMERFEERLGVLEIRVERLEAKVDSMQQELRHEIIHARNAIMIWMGGALTIAVGALAALIKLT